MVTKTAAALMLLALAGCMHDESAPVADPRAVWCEQNEPIRIPAIGIAIMSRADKERVALHNRKGAEWCGWEP